MAAEKKLAFASDYQQGAHPRILERLSAANMEANPGYGTDAHSEHARELIRTACNAPQAEVHFLVGGTQANAVAIDALLAPWQGVVAADSGHVSVHEAGAIEACGHKVIPAAREGWQAWRRRRRCPGNVVGAGREPRPHGHAGAGVHLPANRVRHALLA